MDIALANAFLFDALMLDPEPIDLCALRSWHPDVDIPQFAQMLCELEIAELLEARGVLRCSITARGKDHIAHVVATAMLSKSGEDLGDISDHLFSDRLFSDQSGGGSN